MRITHRIDLRDPDALLDLEALVQERLGGAVDRALIRQTDRYETRPTRESAGDGGSRVAQDPRRIEPPGR